MRVLSFEVSRDLSFQPASPLLSPSITGLIFSVYKRTDYLDGKLKSNCLYALHALSHGYRMAVGFVGRFSQCLCQGTSQPYMQRLQYMNTSLASTPSLSNSCI